MADSFKDNFDRAWNRFNDFRTSQVITPIVVAVVLFALLLVVLIGAFTDLQKNKLFTAEGSLTLLLITGTIALLLTVSALVVVYARVGLTSWRHALGLPEGSVRAIIALLLIVLFFITAVFLYTDVSRPASGETRTLRGISEERLAAIPTDQIVSLTRIEPPTTTTVEGDPPSAEPVILYNVSLRSEKSEASQDLAKQLVTTVSTLVVAIAAFYFGSNSVQQAIDATKQRPEERETTPKEPKPDAEPDPAEPIDESSDLVGGTTADNDDVPDTSSGVPQHHAPLKGAPT